MLSTDRPDSAHAHAIAFVLIFGLIALLVAGAALTQLI